MRKYFRYILGILILVLMISFVPSISTVAGTDVNGDSGEDGGKKPSTELKPGSISQFKSGVLCYITSGHMYTISDVVFLPYSQVPNYKTIGTDMLRARDFTGDSRVKLRPYTLKEVIKSYSGIEWNVPPFSVTSGTGIGSSLKNHLLDVPDPSYPDKTYAMYFISAVFGNEMLVKMQENPDDYYLIFETVIWHGFKASDTQNYAVTTPHVWNVFENRPSRFGYSTDAMNVPHSMYLPETWYIMEAVSPKFGHTEDVSELASPVKGFGMMMVKIDAPEEEQTPQPPSITVTNTSDYLRANELNFIFPDLKTDSRAMREADTYDDATFGINAELESVWKKHVTADDRNQAIKDGKWYIEETITSDIVNKLGLSNGLFYRSSARQYFRPSDAVGLKTVNEGSGMQYAGYGYNLTRTVFDDNMVISSFSSRGDNQSMKSYVKDTLKFDVGHDGVKSNIVMNDNTEGQTSDTAQDKYSFVGKVTEYYEHNDKIHHPAEYEDEYGIDVNGKYSVVGQKKVKDEWDEPNWNSYTADHTTDTKQHDVTHGLFKYTPYTTTTARNTKAGNLLLATGHVGQAYSKVSFASQLSGTLSIYPEVKYEMWYTPSSETWSTPQLKSIYVM